MYCSRYNYIDTSIVKYCTKIQVKCSNLLNIILTNYNGCIIFEFIKYGISYL